MPRPATDLVPITPELLPAVAQFWHTHLDARIAEASWIQAFQPPWEQPADNHGLALLNPQGEVVGAIGALYSTQVLSGKTERLCNVTSWCVLPSYRQDSKSLVAALIRQPGYHFTVFTLRSDLVRIFQLLGFRLLDPRLAVVPHRPWPTDWRRSAPMSESDPVPRQVMADHQNCPRWYQWWYPTATGPVAVVVGRTRYHHLPAAEWLYCSRPGQLHDLIRPIGHHLWWRLGTMVSLIPRRWLLTPPHWSWPATDTQPRLVKSPTLRDADVHYLYSELATLTSGVQPFRRVAEPAPSPPADSPP